MIAAAMVLTQGCLLVVNAVIAPHFDRLGWPGPLTAQILGLQALVGTVATGVSGWLTEHIDPKGMLVGGAIAEGAGMVLLAFAKTLWLVYAFALVFGIGWSVTCLAITVLLIRYFGQKSGTAALSAIWMLSGAATIGPWAVGLVADRTGSFTPALAILGLLLLPIAAAGIAITPPRPMSAEHRVPDYQGAR